MKAPDRPLRSRVGGFLDAGERDAEDSLGSRIDMIRWLIPVRLVVLLAGSSVVGAVCEATTLLVVISAATALAAGDEQIDVSLGPVSIDAVSVDRLLLLAATLAVVRMVFHLLSSYLAARSSSQVLLRLRTQLLSTFLASTWGKQSAEREGHLQDIATTHALESSRAALFMALALTAAVNFAIMVTSAVVVSLIAAAFMALGVVLLYFVFRPLTRLTRAKAKLAAEANSEYATAVSEGASLALESTTFGVEDEVAARLSVRARATAHRLFQVQLLSRSLSGMYQNVALLVLVAGLWAVSGQGDAELSTLGAIVVILLRALSYSQAFQLAQHNVNELLPFARRARDQIDEYEAARRSSGSRPLPTIDTFRFDGVGYAYDESLPVLTGVGFEVVAGEAIGVVGPSGSGKSTLAQVLLRLREPDQGRYLVNGIDAAEYSLDEWRRRVSFVPQEPNMLQGTVRENVRFFRDLEPEVVEAACRAAHIHDEILGWSDGYDTLMGSGSNLLSGGQRQRLCIARALAGQPDLLVLDEPTSALDMRSESAFQETLEHLHGTVTLVIIAHRVPTLKLCDRVMVLREGRLEAFGTPPELLRENAFFAEAVQLSRL